MSRKVFKIGNSLAITLPKSTSLKAGTKVKFVEEKDNKIVYKIVESKSPTLKDEEAKYNNTGGRFETGMSSEKLDKLIEELRKNPYDKTVRLS